jgi:CopA family copper-resistance protein
MLSRKNLTAFACLIFATLVTSIPARGGIVEYDLTIARQEVNITGRPVLGMTINGGIPGPTLRFREGDIARIRVHNKMSVETSIHWHGLLVPPDMDGVPYVSFPPIKAGATFTYEFPIRQSGTYWYHSHTSLQEQSGVYGSIVIEPAGKSGAKPNRDYVLVLSDWTDEDPHEVNRTLKRGSEWFATQKGSGQSILGAARLGMLGDYYKRELQRMPAMDISDVAYDRFLANGKPETTLSAGPGETVRLRIIDGSATTYFHLEFAGGPMTIVSADGQDVEPLKENRFLIGVAETYDVVVQVPVSGAYEFRATAHDGSGYASVWIGSGERHPAPDLPKPNLYFLMPHMRHLSLRRIFSLTPAGTMGFPDSEVEAGKFDKPGMMGMGSMDMDGKNGMDHGPGTSRMHNGGMDHPSGMSEPPPSHEAHGPRRSYDGGRSRFRADRQKVRHRLPPARRRRLRFEKPRRRRHGPCPPMATLCQIAGYETNRFPQGQTRAGNPPDARRRHGALHLASRQQTALGKRFDPHPRG